MKIHYDLFVSKNEKKLIKELVEKYKLFFPHWVNTVVCLRKKESDLISAAEIQLNPRQRTVIISFFDAFFREGHEEEVFIHELTHAIIGELLAWVGDRLFELFKENEEDSLYQYIQGDYLAIVERVTEDLSYTIDLLVNQKKENN